MKNRGKAYLAGFSQPFFERDKLLPVLCSNQAPSCGRKVPNPSPRYNHGTTHEKPLKANFYLGRPEDDIGKKSFYYTIFYRILKVYSTLHTSL